MKGLYNTYLKNSSGNKNKKKEKNGQKDMSGQFTHTH